MLRKKHVLFNVIVIVSMLMSTLGSLSASASSLPDVGVVAPQSDGPFG